MVNPGSLRYELNHEALPALQRALEQRHGNPGAVAEAEAEVDRLLTAIRETELLDARNRAAAASTPVSGGDYESRW